MEANNTIFGKILRVDKVQTEGREPLALELEDFVQAARGQGRPRVRGEDALRAMKLADQILRSINAHKWENVGQNAAEAATLSQAGHALRGPLSWRIQGNRRTRASSSSVVTSRIGRRTPPASRSNGESGSYQSPPGWKACLCCERNGQTLVSISFQTVNLVLQSCNLAPECRFVAAASALPRQPEDAKHRKNGHRDT